MARTLLIYGPSSSGKSANMGAAVDFIATRYGLPCRGIYGDNYGTVQRRIDDGWLDLWDLRTTNDPLACLLLAGQGYWPSHIEKGRATGQLVRKTVDYVNPDGSKRTDIVVPGIGGYICEGLQENGFLIMRNLEAKQRQTGEPLLADFGEMVEQLKVQYSMASRGTYAFVQNQTHRYFKLGLAGLPVEWTFVTTHDFTGLDKAGKQIVGPSVVGPGLTRRVPEWFDHVIHFEQSMVEIALDAEESRRAGGVKSVKRSGTKAHFCKHSDADLPRLLWPAKLGVDPTLMAHIYRTWPRGYVPMLMDREGNLTSSIRDLLELIDPVPVMDEAS
jgi:hypothetical protein